MIALGGVMVCACAGEAPEVDIEPGVPLDLAEARAAAIRDLRYDVRFVLPASRSEAIEGQVTATFAWEGAGPVVFDFAAQPEQVRAVRVGGSPVEAELRAEHLIVPAPGGTGPVTVEIDFTAGDGSLNRQDDFLYTLFVPDRARWSAIQKRATNIGETLNKACSALEEQNSALEGVLAGIDYNDERKLGDARNRDTVLARLVQHFSQVSLRNDRMVEPDLLGRAYEYLIEQFADDAGKKGGEFYTPRMVVKLIVELLAPTEGMRICDPTVGSGGMLIECAHYIERKGGNPRNVTLHGQEKNLSTWAICKMNMLLHGLPDARIEKGDTIRDPKLVNEGELLLYDRVIANPPFSLDEWGRDVAENDGYGRFQFGVPPKTKGDLAFVQHMVAVLNSTGRLGVVMPHGVLFRGSAEGKIREGLLKEDLFEVVIGLAPNLFYGTGIPASILVLNRDKPVARKGRVLFIDASGEFEEGSNQNRLRDQDIKQIASTFRTYADVEKYARVVPIAEIEANDWNLNISRYVDTSEKEERIDVAEAVRKLRELERERAAAEATMNRYLAELGFEA